MGMAQSTIKKFIASLDNTTLSGKAALDEATRNSSKFNSWQEVVDKMISGINHYKSHNNYEGFLMDKCGINIHNEDTGAISGFDAGNGIVKTKESIVQESGELKYPTAKVTNIKGLNVVWPDKSTLSKKQQEIVSAMYSWWIPGALDLIQESYGLSINDASNTKTMKVEFIYNNTSKLLSNGGVSIANIKQKTKTINGVSKSTELTFRINMNANTSGGYWNNMDVSNMNGVPINSTDNKYGDALVAHEMTHAVMSANINNYDSLTQYANYMDEGFAELLLGKDDYNYWMKQIFNDSNILKSISEKGWDDSLSSGVNYTAGTMLLRYFAKQANILEPEGSVVNGDTIKLDKNFYTELWLDGKNIFSGEEIYKNDNIKTIDAKDTTNSGMLAGNNLDNTIISGSGNTDLWGGWQGNDRLVGGNGENEFWVGKLQGNDIIENSNNDIVNFWNVKLSDISGIYTNNNDIVFSFFDGGTVNIKDAKNANNTYVLGEEHTSYRYINDGKDTWALLNS